MDKFVKLGQDMALLLDKYHPMYTERYQEHADPGLVGHADRLLHRPAVRYPEYHPLYEERSPAQAVPSEAAAGHHPHLCGGLSWHAHGAAGRVYLLRPALLLQQCPAVRQHLGRRPADRVHQHRCVHGGVRPGRHHLHRPRPDGGRQGHRHDPLSRPW